MIGNQTPVCKSWKWCAMPGNLRRSHPLPVEDDEPPLVDMPETPLARLVEAALTRSGDTLEAVSRRSGIPVSSINAYKHGDITGERTQRTRLTQLAKALNIPEDDVLEAAGQAQNAGDEVTLIRLFRRLPSDADKAQAVETLKVHVTYARARTRPR